ncbi:MAG: Carbonic anhydrase precursor [Methanomassiliicoccales archaeon PtaU1.Bin030]|nr:MAG: Carbonic anhydrase precursor [Methanomassiliicoccales archaeon PtaU1.Bin030]
MLVLKEPKIGNGTYVDPSSSILGDVTIGSGVYVAPNASIRADEPGSKIVIEDECNIQDNVIIHALSGSTVRVGVGSTLAHGCIVHGPCTIGKGCFIGFGSILFDCTLMDGCVVLHRALLTNSHISSSRLISNGAIIDGDLNGDGLPEVPEHHRRFADSVREMNVELASMYGRSRQDDMNRIIGGKQQIY